MSDILKPAIDLAEEGFPVSTISADLWQKSEDVLKRWQKSHAEDLLIAGKAPRAGQVFRNPALAETLRVSTKCFLISLIARMFFGNISLSIIF